MCEYCWSGSVLERGQKVMTPLGSGVIQYKRMAPPDYSFVDVYSVRLDSRVSDVTYAGTIFPAKQVVHIGI